MKGWVVVVRTLVVGGCWAMEGCASSAISFSAAHWVKPPASSYGERLLVSLEASTGETKRPPSRDLIEIDFTASADIRRMARRGGVVIFVHSYICDRGDNYVGIGGPGVYIGPVDAKGQRSDSFSVYRNKEYGGEYAFFVDVRRKDHPGDIPSQQAFDLAVKPEDICFFVTGHGALLTFYKSSVARVPKAVISDVLREDAAIR